MKITCNTPALIYCDENGVYLSKEDLYHKKPYIRAVFTLTYHPIPELSEQTRLPVVYDPESEIMRLLPLMIKITESDQMYETLLAIFKECEPQIAIPLPASSWNQAIYSDFDITTHTHTISTSTDIDSSPTFWTNLTSGGYTSNSSTI